MTNNNDFIIDNNTGQQVRIDIQEALQQLASNNFGTNPPVTTATPPVQVAFPHQWFANGDTGKLMYKDASTGNNAETNYFNLANLNGGLFVDQTSTFNGSVIFNGTSASSGTITFDPTATNGLGALKFTSGSNCFFGDSNQFSIGHLGSIGGFIGSSVGTVFINGKATGGAFTYAILLQTSNSDGGLDSAYRAYDDGRQELFFGGVPKFQTSADGIEVIGNILPTTDNDKPLGSSSKRFSTLHSGALNTGDINMSNLNDNGNEIDGSKGSWSIQEGSDDLFLINRVSGKKYKFNLTEIT